MHSKITLGNMISATPNLIDLPTTACRCCAACDAACPYRIPTSVTATSRTSWLSPGKGSPPQQRIRDSFSASHKRFLFLEYSDNAWLCPLDEGNLSRF